ncbi:hypothetical protein [Caenimonas soli]|uniref:hypothetical protein n=1 Tax=Caenimonas soli TaxID=2735555 RepID=UPI001554B61D|nr:hypothetical protein [Caenimonas soli]NPC58378.1 hypothetical protein [Caenimonas soli]
METLRRARFIARLVLAWFAVSVGIAIASPIVNPQGLELVCSAAGAIKILVKGEDGSTQAKSHTLDCPMCAAMDAPLPAGLQPIPAALPLSRAMQSIPTARLAGLTAAPLPARGPPSPLSI